MHIETTCRKCGATFHLDLGDMSREMAERAFRTLDNTSRQCPGHHVELGGWYELWNLEDALHRAYDLGEGKELDVQTDEDFVRALLADGKEIVDGGSGTVPELHLPSIHEQRNLTHLGFGNFSTHTHTYFRCDSPSGTRFYERVEKEGADVV